MIFDFFRKTGACFAYNFWTDQKIMALLFFIGGGQFGSRRILGGIVLFLFEKIRGGMLCLGIIQQLFLW
jgi:hypothetical protein